MKKECDANGLEYELMMQESAKERFLREIKGNGLDFNRNFVILKQKRQNAAPAVTDPRVAAPAPVVAAAEPTNEPIVGAAEPSTEEPRLAAPFAALTALGGKAAIAGKTAIAGLTVPKLLVLMRERLAGGNPAPARRPLVLPPITSTAAPAKLTLPTLPTLPPFRAFGPVQPLHTLRN